MYSLALDESGTHQDAPVVVVGGIALHETDIDRLEKVVESVLSTHLVPLGLAVHEFEVCLTAAPMLAVTAAVADPAAVVQVPSRSEALALFYMAVLTTAAAFLLWYDGVVRLGADRAGLFAGVMPVAGYVAGVALGTSVASATALVGAVLCGVGVAVGMTAGTRRRSAVQARFSDQSPARAGEG